MNTSNKYLGFTLYLLGLSAALAASACNSSDVKTAVLPKGDQHCPNGGEQITIELDSHTATAYACNGMDGSAASIVVTELSAGNASQCNGVGGYEIEIAQGGKTLDPIKVCNGQFTDLIITSIAPGSPGCTSGGVSIATGASSAPAYVCNGQSPIVQPEPPGSNCPYGGTKITDASTTSFACNGAPATIEKHNVSGPAQVPDSTPGNPGNNAYLTSGASTVDINLPAHPQLGDVISVQGGGAAWKITQNPGQLIKNLPVSSRTFKVQQVQSIPANAYISKMVYSADGSVLVGISSTMTTTGTAGGRIFTSKDDGLTWSQTGAPTAIWDDIAISADGSTMIAEDFPVAPEYGHIWVSIDGGKTWASQAALPTAVQWSAVGISADGKYMIAAGSNGNCYTKKGAGQWTKISPMLYGNATVSAIATIGPIAGDPAVYHSFILSALQPQYGFLDLDGNGMQHVPSFAASGGINSPIPDFRKISCSGTTCIASTAAPEGSQVYVLHYDPGLNNPYQMVVDLQPSIQPVGVNWLVNSANNGATLMASSPFNNNQVFMSTNGGSTWEKFSLASTSASNFDGYLFGAGVVSPVSGKVIQNLGLGSATMPNEGNRFAVSLATTTPGTAGSLGGGSFDSVDLIYIGNGQFLITDYGISSVSTANSGITSK